ncbi:MAG: DUF2905 domain-containing protein [Elusimicrobia bacterium]|nr:DUF2905 domain-containing protein [Elusimicrobiota bacterium]
MPSSFGKTLIVLGAILIVVGLAFQAGGHFPIGRLPGDIHIKRQNVDFYFPLTTSLLLSLLLSAFFWLFRR